MQFYCRSNATDSMLDEENVISITFSSSPSNADQNGFDDNKSKALNASVIDDLVDQLSRQSLKQGVREAANQLTRNKQNKRNSLLPFIPVELTMTQILCIALVGWLTTVLFRYVFIADGRLATRSPKAPAPFFPLNSGITDFYQGDGASYAELYNLGDLTILMFYAPWSLHSLEARNHFVRLANLFKGFENVKFSAVNCDVGQCKRSFKLYSYPVIIALTSFNTAIFYEDYPVTKSMFSWVVKLLMPMHKVDSLNDLLLQNNKYDHIALAYLPLEKGQITHAYKVYQLAAMKNKERTLFAVTISQEIADHFQLNRTQLRLLNSSNVYEINANTTSVNILNFVYTESSALKHLTIHWIKQDYNNDGGKSVHFHSLFKHSRALMVLMTTPLTSLQTSSNLEKMRVLALFYNDCSKSNRFEWVNWAKQFVVESELVCQFQPEMVSDCCNTMWHDRFCNKSSKQTTDLTKLYYTDHCSKVLGLFGEERVYNHCCVKKQSKQLKLSFKQQISCRYHTLLKAASSKVLKEYSSTEASTFLPHLDSHGLACQTNRTVMFAAMDKHHSGHFLRAWNLNSTAGNSDDYLILISLDDEALYVRRIDDAFTDVDKLLTGYANTSLEPAVLDESKQKSYFSQVKPDVKEDEIDRLSTIDRLTANTFKTKILNDANRTYSAVVYFSGGSWHGQSMAATQVFHTVHHEFANFNTLIRFFIIDTSRNSLPWSYVFDSLPAVMFFPAQPFPMSQSAHFPNDLIFTVPNIIAFLLARAQPELRFRVALRGCNRLCLESNRQRLLLFEDVLRKDIRTLRLLKRKFAYKFGANFVKLMLKKRKLQKKASRYLHNVLKILHSNQTSDVQLSLNNETLIVKDSLLLRWLLSNNFGTNFNLHRLLKL